MAQEATPHLTSSRGRVLTLRTIVCNGKLGHVFIDETDAGE